MQVFNKYRTQGDATYIDRTTDMSDSFAISNESKYSFRKI